MIDTTTARRRSRGALLMTGAIAALILAVSAYGCAARARQPSLTPATAELDPATQVFTHCRELVCTQAPVPGCDFSEVVQSGKLYPMRENFRCARVGLGTICEERRSRIGLEDAELENQVLKFECSGDPVQCQVLGGNAPWPAPLNSPGFASGLSCRSPSPGGPPPALRPIPGPNTAMR